MARGSRIGVKESSRKRIHQREHDSEESDEEYRVTEDEDCDESDEFYTLDGDESEEIVPDFGESRRVSRSRNIRRISSGKKVNVIMKPRKRRKVVYTENDDDDDEEEEVVAEKDDGDDDEEGQVADEDDAQFMSLGRESNQINKPMEKKRVSYTEVINGGGGEDDDDVDCENYAAFVSSGRKRNQKRKPLEKKRIIYNGFMSFGRQVKQNKNPTVRERVSYTKENDSDGDCENEEDYAEIVSSGRKRNQRRKPLVFTNDDDDDEFMYSGRKVNHKKNLQEKRKVTYTEDDYDDSLCMYPSRKGDQIKVASRKRTDSYKEDNQEEEDENDAEFKLSESDFVDDEDDTPKKNDKVSRSTPQKKSVRGRQKKCKKSKLKEPARPYQVVHRSGKKLTQIKNRKKISKRRKHREMAESDSDFVNSASSNHEYTISEEEREQMREARVYRANLRDKLRRSSCGNQEHHPAYEQRKYPIRKGKEKIVDMKDEVGNQVCGICLSEKQKRTVRGILNCCQHYFCFSCIMEWSKVESRCPLCKQRFASISKAAKSDTRFDSRTVVIKVPECDQVYEPSEEELRGYLDPYESVICTECHNGGDDALMLLCDICDSSAHTFCVGLRCEVPEGNWYCEGCRPTVFGTLNSQHPTPYSDRGLSSNASDLSSPIAGRFDLNELYVPETPLTQQTRVLPEPIPAPVGTVAATLTDIRRTHHQFLNNNRTSDYFVGISSGTLASSSGIRLFGSQLDQNDHIFSSQNSDLASVDVSLQDGHGWFGMGMGMCMGFDSRLGYAQLHPCTNRSTMMVDACREVIVPSRTSQGGLHTPN